MVRVLAVADEEVPGFESRARDLHVDLLLGAGDLPWGYLEAVAELVAAPAVFVPGNHDPAPTPSARGPRGFLDADQGVLDVAGLRIAGLGGCVRYNRGANQHTQAEYDVRARRLVKAARRTGPGTVDVLLTHAPPLGLGDEPDPSHLGIEALHGVIDALRPTWHLHGHIHPYGLRKDDRTLGATTIRNVIPWHVLDIEPVALQRPASAAEGGS